MREEQYIEVLLTAPSEEQRRHLLLQEGPKILSLSFFTQLKEYILEIKDRDRPRQNSLAEILALALEVAPDKACQAMGFWGLSLACAYQENWESAINHSKQAMGIYQQINELEAYGTLGANLLFYLVTKENNLKEADRLAKELEVTLVPYAPSPALGRIYRHWALIKVDLHESERALELMNLARPYIWESGDPWRKAAFLGDIAPVYLQLDRFEDAATCLKELEGFCREIPERQFFWAKTAYRLIELYHRRGQLGEALRIADEAILLYQSQQRLPLALARVVLRQVEVLLDLEQHALVLERLAGLQDVLLESRREQMYSILLAGLAFMGVGQMEEAEANLLWSIQQLEDEFSQWKMIGQFALGRLYLEWGLLDNVPLHLQTGQALVKSLLDKLTPHLPIRAAEASLLLAEYDLHLQNFEETRQGLKEIEEHIRSFPHLKAQHLYLSGKLAYIQKDWTKARYCYEAALELVIEQRAQLYLEALQADVMARREPLFQGLIEICLVQNDWIGVWQYSEISRAYSLTAALAKESWIIPFEIEPERKPTPPPRALLDLRGERFQLCSQLYGHEQDSVLSPEQSAEIHQKILGLDKKISAWYHFASKDGASFSPHTVFSPASIDQVAQSLPPGTLLVIFNRLENQLVCMGIANDGLVVRQIFPVNWDEVDLQTMRFAQIGWQRWCETWLHRGYDETMRNFETFLSETNSQLTQLYRLIWLGLEEYVVAYPHLILSPGQELARIPFQALFNGQEYLIDRHTITYVPNASIYALCRQRAHLRKNSLGREVTLFGYAGQQNQLPYIERELKRVQEIYPEAQILFGPQATASTLRHLAASARVLHLATHSEMVNRNPFLSYLDLASENHGKEGSGKTAQRFRVYDIAQLNLHQTDFVCLSGCETGRTSPKGGDLLGLQWGVFSAGANALLANQWPVDDYAAAEFMPIFYQEYANGLDKALALQKAQIALRKRGEANLTSGDWRLAHPYHWAPFAFYGYTGAL